jgi:hypothetical protein
MQEYIEIPVSDFNQHRIEYMSGKRFLLDHFSTSVNDDPSQYSMTFSARDRVDAMIKRDIAYWTLEVLPRPKVYSNEEGNLVEYGVLEISPDHDLYVKVKRLDTTPDQNIRMSIRGKIL